MPTIVRPGATIGANATIVCGSTIGKHAFVAAGTVVTRDVADHALVRGNPARQAGWICECGEALDDDLRCICERKYRLTAGRLKGQTDASTHSTTAERSWPTTSAP